MVLGTSLNFLVVCCLYVFWASRIWRRSRRRRCLGCRQVCNLRKTPPICKSYRLFLCLTISYWKSSNRTHRWKWWYMTQNAAYFELRHPESNCISDSKSCLAEFWFWCLKSPLFWLCTLFWAYYQTIQVFYSFLYILQMLRWPSPSCKSSLKVIEQKSVWIQNESIFLFWCLQRTYLDFVVPRRWSC